jgi:hypothetical protein
MSKHSILILVFITSKLTFLQSQEIQSIGIESISKQPSSMGVVNPFEGLGGVTMAYHLFADHANTDSSQYTMHQLIFGGVLQLTNSFDIGAQLPEKHHLLHQVVKDGRWYVLGFEELRSDSVRYFLSVIDLKNTEPIIKYPLNYFETIFHEKVVDIVNADVLNNDEIAFVGRRKNIGKPISKGLVILYNTTTDAWRRIEVVNDDSSNEKSVFSINAFYANDSLYVLDGMNSISQGQSEALSVYDQDFNLIGQRPIPESNTEPGNSDYNFGLGLSFTKWGEGFVFAGRSIYESSKGTKEDFYFHEYDAIFNLIFDERYYNVPRERTPYHQSFYPLTNDYGVMVSHEFGAFGVIGNRNLYLRLYNRNTNTSTSKLLRDEDFSHFADGIVVDLKLLMVGFSTQDNASRDIKIRYYVADYSKMNVGVNEETKPKSDLNIYPNPAQSQVNLSWRGMQKQNWLVKLYDNQGRLVYATEVLQGTSETTIQLPELPSGNYIIRAEGSGKQVHTGTLVME